MSKKSKDFFDKWDALRSAPRLSAKGGQFDARSARSVFAHVHAAGENRFYFFRACERELCEAFLVAIFCGVCYNGVALKFRRALPETFQNSGGPTTLLILGIDPGIATIGFGLIDADRSRARMLRYGAITTPAGVPLTKRLFQIETDMEALIAQLHPEAISVEELFFNSNITTGIAVAHGRGVILYAAEKCGVPLFEYTPSQVKQAVVGYGRAEKRQVMEMTKMLLKLKTLPRPDDAADALALALCHARSCTSLLSQDPNVQQTI